MWRRLALLTALLVVALTGCERSPCALDHRAWKDEQRRRRAETSVTCPGAEVRHVRCEAAVANDVIPGPERCVCESGGATRYVPTTVDHYALMAPTPLSGNQTRALARAIAKGCDWPEVAPR